MGPSLFWASGGGKPQLPSLGTCLADGPGAYRVRRGLTARAFCRARVSGSCQKSGPVNGTCKQKLEQRYSGADCLHHIAFCVAGPVILHTDCYRLASDSIAPDRRDRTARIARLRSLSPSPVLPLLERAGKAAAAAATRNKDPVGHHPFHSAHSHAFASSVSGTVP